MKTQIIKNNIEQIKAKLAWRNGVKDYALELLDNAIDYGYEYLTKANAEEILLNGADDWNAYSWGGCSSIYNCDIANSLCTASELKRTRNGELRPNAKEQWLDVQARALYQAYRLIESYLE